MHVEHNGTLCNGRLPSLPPHLLSQAFVLEHRPCPRGSFSVDWESADDSRCMPLLGCLEMEKIATAPEAFAGGGVKRQYRGLWQPPATSSRVQRPPMAVVVARGAAHVKADFVHGANMLQRLGPHPRLVPLLGTCLDRLEMITPVSTRTLMVVAWDAALPAIEFPLRAHDFACFPVHPLATDSSTMRMAAAISWAPCSGSWRSRAA